MSTMIVGGGGREHAMAEAFTQGEYPKLYFTDGNAGMNTLGTNLHIDGVGRITAAALAHEVDFVVIGPEKPLADGLADSLRSENISVLGFGAEAAQLESSKSYAIDFMKRFDIPHPQSWVADSKLIAMRRLNSFLPPESIVLKANGPADGKGVILPDTYQEAEDAINGLMSGAMFGDAGKRVVIQLRETGPEISMMALYDGKNTNVLFLAQDHKRLKDNDEGPNTGGMGSYAPVPSEIVSDRQLDLMREALEKTTYGLERRGLNEPGVIYIGFMLTEGRGGDPVVIEYNMRFGDPELQAGLTLMTDAGIDAHELFHSAAVGGMDDWDSYTRLLGAGRAAVAVCLAANGYPERKPRKGDVISGLNHDYGDDVKIYHGASYYNKEGYIQTAGGRVIYVTGLGDSVEKAASRAYSAIGPTGVHFDEMQYRTDIAHQARSSE
jgi:phosphoribosylamine--glycine ligase